MKKLQRGLALSTSTKLSINLSKGFTLIELLVVIAILGVLAAGVVVAINPAKRIKQANDAKIKNDIDQIATAMQSYFTTSTYQEYPLTVAALVTSTDLKTEPKTPGAGAIYDVAYTATYCADSSAATVCEASVSTKLQDPKTANNLWCWQSVTGKACEAATCPVTAIVCIP